MSNKVALITGITGQDGAYLEEFLLDKGCKVHGIKRRSPSFETPEYTAGIVGLGALRVLEAIRISGLEKKTRYYQAPTSELNGAVVPVELHGNFLSFKVGCK